MLVVCVLLGSCQTCRYDEHAADEALGKTSWQEASQDIAMPVAYNPKIGVHTFQVSELVRQIDDARLSLGSACTYQHATAPCRSVRMHTDQDAALALLFPLS